MLPDDRKSRTFSASGHATFATGSVLRSLAPFVPMVQSAHPRQRDDFRRRRRSRRDRSLVRRVFTEPQVATILVIVADICPHEPDEMPLAEDNDVLEKLATAISDPAFSGSVLPRTAIGDANRLCAHGPYELDHRRAE